METETSRCTGIPVEATKISVKREKLCLYKRNIPVHRDEVKWNLKRRLTRENLQKRKQKETTFDGMLFMRTKLVFVLLINCYQLFHALWNRYEITQGSNHNLTMVLCLEFLFTRYPLTISWGVVTTSQKNWGGVHESQKNIFMIPVISKQWENFMILQLSELVEIHNLK